MIRIALLIIIASLAACTKTTVIEHGKVEPELRVYIEDFVDLTEDEIKAKYLNKKVTFVKTTTGICGLQAGGKNQCLRQYGLRDLVNVTEPPLEIHEYPVQVDISAYFNYTKRSHSYYVKNSDGNPTMPSDEQLSHRIEINENVTQNPCFHPEYAPMSNIQPSDPDQPWKGCELTYPSIITGLVFRVYLFEPPEGSYAPKSVRLSIIPTGFSYTLEKPWF